MLSLWMVLAATGLIAGSGVPGLLLNRRSPTGQWSAALLNILGSAVGGAALILFILGHANSHEVSYAWALPIGKFAVGIDALSLWFLIPMLLVSSVGSVYGLEYWAQSANPGNGRKLRLFWGLMTAGMMLVVLARDAVVFLMAWELMALAAFFLVTTEETKAEVRRAGWIYLVATHVGTLTLFAMFALLRLANGSFELWIPAAPEVSSGLITAIFLTGIVGFGLKAGIIPLHIWLPNAHANAPSHVSAILSGVLLKTGVYGLLRITALVPHPPLWWGWTLLVIGGGAGLLGIAFAISQQDFKRLLAYSSIENIGIIMMGIGLAVLGRSVGRTEWILLGLGGALLHVLNHSLYKPLLFLGAGCVLHATHTRQLDRLGGLGKRMPRTYWLCVVGALAICGLPPLNGFVSELLIYLGLLQTVTDPSAGPAIWAALAVPTLAMIGALAVATFVKLIGTMFGGLPRSASARQAHDPGLLMLGPMGLLAVCCGLIGLAPRLVLGFLDRIIAVWNPQVVGSDQSCQTVFPGVWIAVLGVSLLGGSLGIYLLLRRWRRRYPGASVATWDCGYSRPTGRMQYSSSSFGQLLTELFGWALFTRKYGPKLGGLFARRSAFRSETPDPVLDRLVWPACAVVNRAALWARFVQMGSVQAYILYVLAALLVLGLVSWW